jgi:hypothetical protein
MATNVILFCLLSPHKLLNIHYIYGNGGHGEENLCVRRVSVSIAALKCGFRACVDVADARNAGVFFLEYFVIMI